MREQIIDVYRFDGESFAKEERDGSEATRRDSTHTMTKYTPRREIHHITRLPLNHRASIDATRFRRLAPPPRPLSVRFFTRRRCLRTSPRSPRRRPRARRPTPKHHLRPPPRASSVLEDSAARAPPPPPPLGAQLRELRLQRRRDEERVRLPPVRRHHLRADGQARVDAESHRHRHRRHARERRRHRHRVRRVRLGDRRTRWVRRTIPGVRRTIFGVEPPERLFIGVHHPGRDRGRGGREEDVHARLALRSRAPQTPVRAPEPEPGGALRAANGV